MFLQQEPTTQQTPSAANRCHSGLNIQSIFRLAFSRKSIAVFSTTRIAFAKDPNLLWLVESVFGAKDETKNSLKV